MDAEPEHVVRNRDAWNRWAPGYAEHAARAWAEDEPSWGIFSIPEREVRALPESLAGLDVIELGCGTAYFSAWMAKAGARPVGVDISDEQLKTARALQAEHGLDFPLHLGNAEETPYPDASFDLVISEYGASIWCDPYRWIPEAARLLRPGGRLAFLANGVFLIVSTPPDAAEDTPASERLERPYFGLYRTPWEDGTVNFYLEHGAWIRLLRDHGFEVLDLVEVQAPEGTTASAPIFTTEWARQWPAEEIWVARLGPSETGAP